MKKIRIGSVTLENNVVMDNLQFQYAASYERLEVPQGTYPIFVYADDVRNYDGKIQLDWRNYIRFEGTVISGNVGGNPGDHTTYSVMTYDYILADYFMKGYTDIYDDYDRHKRVRCNYELAPEWGIEINDFISCIDGKRMFAKRIFLKDSDNVPYMDDEA